MDDLYEKQMDTYLRADSFFQELDEWFTVSGDAEDFIFYGEDVRRHSER